MGAAFFDEVARLAALAGAAAVTTSPADPVSKAIARKDRRDGGNSEADECAAA